MEPGEEPEAATSGRALPVAKTPTRFAQLLSNRLPEVVPLLLAIAILVVGVEVGHIPGKDFWRAVLVVAVAASTIGLSVGIAVFAGRQRWDERVEGHIGTLANVHHAAVETVRQSAFTALAGMASAAQAGARPIEVLTPDEAASIERTADDVWVYSYDMAWDFESTPMSRAVKANLLERRQYRYLIPDDEDVIERACNFVHSLRSVPDLHEVLEFRKRDRELPFSRFAITIYNPKTRRFRDELEPVVILLPHFNTSPTGAVMLKVTRPYTSDYEEEFVRIWRHSQPLRIDEMLNDRP